MAITVLDGTTVNEVNVAATVGDVTSDISVQVTAGDTTREIVLDRALGPVTSSIGLSYTSPGGFDWTHGLGDLRLDAETIMGSRWGVGAAGTVVINSKSNLESYETFRTFFSTLGDYVTYNVTPPQNFTWDLLIDLRGESSALPYGIHVGVFRHVIVLGAEVDLLPQTTDWLQAYNPASTRGNEQFTCANKLYSGQFSSDWAPGKDLHEVDDPVNNFFNNPGGYTSAFDNERLPYKGWNTHTRMAGATMLRLQNSGYAWVEGCYLDARGQQGDGIILARQNNSSSPEYESPSDAAANRRLYVVNSNILNYEGQSRHRNYGDGIHGDSVHSQGGSPHSMWFENVNVLSGQEGQVHTGSAGDEMQHLFVRNAQYGFSTTYAANVRNLDDYSPPGEKQGGPGWSNRRATLSQRGEFDQGGRWYIENLWFNAKSGNRVRLADGVQVNSDAQINTGISPIDFAPAFVTGTNYNNTSPWNSFYNGLS